MPPPVKVDAPKKKILTPKKETAPKSDSIPSERVLSSSFVKDFFENEDQEAKRSSPNTDRDAFISLSKEVFKNCCKIVESKSNNVEQSEQEKMKHELYERTMLNLISMRRMNCLAQLRNKMRRDTVAEDRQKVDEFYLQLQNLLYEVSHIEQEVARCTDFRSADEDIDLVPIDQFYKEADPEISKPEITKNDKHLQALARLQWELKCRQTLALEIDKVRQDKDEIEKEIEAKQALLDSLQPKLELLLEASKPVQELFGVNYEQGMLQTKSASHLPAPLFYAYVQISAYKDIFDPTLSITIEGDLDKARRFGVDHKSNKMESSDEEMIDEITDNDIDKRKKSRKMNRRLTITDAEEEKIPDINCAPHPLHLDVKLNCKDQALLLLSISFIPKRGIATIKTKLELKADVPRALASASELLDDDIILSNLLDNDDNGESCPSSVSMVRLKQTKFFRQDHALNFDLVGRPYKWAQAICGIHLVDNAKTSSPDRADEQTADTDAEKSDFEANVEDSSDSNDGSCLQTTLKAIKRRILARLALQEQISSLENLNCHHTPKDVDNWFSCKELSNFVSWKPLTHESFLKEYSTRKLSRTHKICENGWFFGAKFESSKSILSALIYVHCDYPTSSPFVLLKLEDTSNISSHGNLLRHLEKAINVECPLKTPKKVRNQILCIQIRYLLNRLDVIRELLMIEASDKSVKREHLYKRLSRGRDRQPPLNFSSLENCWNFEFKLV